LFSNELEALLVLACLGDGAVLSTAFCWLLLPTDNATIHTFGGIQLRIDGVIAHEGEAAQF
jgi:hypothetical protein